MSSPAYGSDKSDEPNKKTRSGKKQQLEKRSEKNDLAFLKTKKGFGIVYDEILLHEFKQVPLTSRDESEWYGPWGSLLYRLFPPQEGFQIAPQHQRPRILGGPEWTIFFIVRHQGYIDACIIEVKPFNNYQYPRLRLSAYQQLYDRLSICIEDNPSGNAAAIYGLSCLGPRFMIMKLNTQAKHIRPEVDGSVPQTSQAPQEWWGYHALRKSGCLALHRLAAEVKKSLSPRLELVANQPVSLDSLPDDDTNFEFSWEDHDEKDKKGKDKFQA